jgi:N-acetylneuraminic acid mutarotase
LDSIGDESLERDTIMPKTSSEKRLGWFGIAAPVLMILVMGASTLPVMAQGQAQGIAPRIGLSAPALEADATSPWSATGALKTARYGFISVLLNNSKVLVAGGASSSGVLGSAELYDLSTAAWTTTGVMKTARGGMAAVLLPDGTVLTAGGSTGSAPMNNAEIYDPTAGTWANTSGTLPIALAFPSATLLDNGKVLIAGGMNSTKNGSPNAYLYDPATKTFTATGSMNVGRVYHTATLLPNHKVLITGGSTNAKNALATTELYDPDTGTWTPAASLNPMNGIREAHTATLLSNGKVLVAGGTTDITATLNTSELYDPGSGTWTLIGNLSAKRQLHTAALLSNGKVLLVGGADENNMLSSADLYDPNNGTNGSWSAVGYAMASPRLYHGTVLLTNHKVLVIGGMTTNNSVIAACELFDGRDEVGITLGGLSQTYNGSPIPVTVTTNPSGHESDVAVTYAGSTTPPTNAGTYSVSAVLNTNDYRGSATGSLIIGKASATVSISAGSLSQTYDGNPKAATATTVPASLSVGFTYTGISPTNYPASSQAPSNAGSYRVDAAISDTNYQGSATGTLTINKAAATISLTNLNQTYDGTAKPAGATTNPTGLSVAFTYLGIGSTNYPSTSAAPTNAGAYQVDAVISNANYTGSARDTLTIAKASATTSLSNLNQTYTGSPRPVTVTTHPAGVGVTLSYVGKDPAGYGPTDVAPTQAGTYTVTAVINDPNYQGPDTSGDLAIAKASAAVTLHNLSWAYDGNPKAATTTTIPAGLTTQISYTGVAPLVYGPTTAAPTEVGTYDVVASIQDTNYQGQVTDTLIIATNLGGVTITGLTQTYTGAPRSVTVVTVPSGLAYTLSYQGSSSDGKAYGPTSNAPIHSGTYTVTATVVDSTYQGKAVETLTIQKAAATITITNLTQTFDGNPKAVQITSNPAGLAITVTYTGLGSSSYGPVVEAPTKIGTYRVEAAVQDADYQGSASETLTIVQVAHSGGAIYLPMVIQ